MEFTHTRSQTPDTGVETAVTTGKPQGSVLKNLSEGSRLRSGWLGGTAAASPQAYQKSHSAESSTKSALIYAWLWNSGALLR